MKKFDENAVLSALTNLILTPGVREWERQQLIDAKNSGDYKNLEWVLRPHALRGSLSPDMTEFYAFLTTGIAPTRFNRKEIDPMNAADEHLDSAIFAGGCFWCMVQPFEELSGILSVTSGYTGGHQDNPTYEQVCAHLTGHTEAVEIIFDTTKISYDELVTLYWQLTDPSDAFGQFEDRGDNYRPVIFVNSKAQRAQAEASKQRLLDTKKFEQPIVTTIEDAQKFWPAENYHQDFYKKNPERYKASSAIRHRFLRRNWA
ncbi:MAG: peptide-methionine (S)-S-oxide reductase MsrA [Streptococcaceae bacterium]|nr:peptide-methionine (S)-S-oxide reductase MsrA [Streptococcaceae bacterium]